MHNRKTFWIVVGVLLACVVGANLFAQVLQHRRAAFRGAGGFVPTDVVGLKFWYQGNSYDGTTATDLSGNANHATQGTADNRPSYQAASQNGNDVIRFDGSNDFLEIGTGITLTSLTYFVTTKIDPTFVVKAILGSAAGNSPELRVSATEKVELEKEGVAGIVAGSVDVVDAAWHVIEVTYNGSTGDGTIYIDGTQDATANSSQTFGALNRIGRDAFGNYIDADMMDILVYDSVLSSGDRTSVRTYIAARAAITLP